MGEFTVEIEKCRQADNELLGYSKDLRQISEEIKNISKRLVERQSSLGQIKNNLYKISDEIYSQQDKLRKMQTVMSSCMDIYEETEKDILSQKLLAENANDNSSKFSLLEMFGISLDDDGTKNLIDKLLKILEKFKIVPEAGMVKNLDSYFEALLSFLTGDKKGYSGASDLAVLSDKSAGVWSSLYEYFKNADPSKGIEKKFSGIAGLVSLFQALSGMANKTFIALDADGKLQGQVISEWIDVGSEGVSLAKAFYKLFGGKDGAGYFTLAKTITSTFSQAIESIAEYSADGVFDMEDWGATGIDVSIKGISTMINGITYGIIDIDAEYVADFIKDFGRDFGKMAGNYINNNPGLLEQYNNGNEFERFGITMWSIFATAFGG